MMLVLVPCSLLMVGGILQGLIRLRRFRVIPPDIDRSVSAIRSPGDRTGFLNSMSRHAAPLAHAVWFTLKHFNESMPRPCRSVMQQSLDDAMVEVEEELHSGLSLLSPLYTVAPLLESLKGTPVYIIFPHQDDHPARFKLMSYKLDLWAIDMTP